MTAMHEQMEPAQIKIAYRNIAAQHAPILQPTILLTKVTKSSINAPNNTGESTPPCLTPVFSS